MAFLFFSISDRIDSRVSVSADDIEFGSIRDKSYLVMLVAVLPVMALLLCLVVAVSDGWRSRSVRCFSDRVPVGVGAGLLASILLRSLYTDGIDQYSG